MEEICLDNKVSGMEEGRWIKFMVSQDDEMSIRRNEMTCKGLENI